MPARNPALKSEIIGLVAVYYKDSLETLSYSVDLSRLLAANETVNAGSVTISVQPHDVSIDFLHIADQTSITLFIDTGGEINRTYEFTIQFSSNLGTPYVDYMRCNIKQVYKKC